MIYEVLILGYKEDGTPSEEEMSLGSFPSEREALAFVDSRIDELEDNKPFPNSEIVIEERSEDGEFIDRVYEEEI